MLLNECAVDRFTRQRTVSSYANCSLGQTITFSVGDFEAIKHIASGQFFQTALTRREAITSLQMAEMLNKLFYGKLSHKCIMHQFQ